MRRLAPGLVFVAHGAAAMELDSLLPTDIPGLGAGLSVSILTRPEPLYTSAGLSFGTVSLSPMLSAGAGYDSAVDGTAGAAAEYMLTPSLVVKDEAAGFAAYATGAITATPGLAGRNTSSFALAAGQGFTLPREIFTLAGVYARADATGLTLDAAALPKPVAFTVTGISAQDKITAGMFTVSPSVGSIQTRSAAAQVPDATDLRQELNVEFTPGGPARGVFLFTASQQRYRNRYENVDSEAALAGVADDATGIWDFRLLGGVAARFPAYGGALAAPVLEASAAWMPDGLDSFRFDAVREIDDPEQIGAAGYTLTQVKLSAAHEYLRNLDLTAGLNASHAGFFRNGLDEILLTAGAGAIWHLNRQLALAAAYRFNDRQANFLRAANEHVVTISMNWTP